MSIHPIDDNIPSQVGRVRLTADSSVCIAESSEGAPRMTHVLSTVMVWRPAGDPRDLWGTVDNTSPHGMVSEKFCFCFKINVKTRISEDMS